MKIITRSIIMQQSELINVLLFTFVFHITCATPILPRYADEEDGPSFFSESVQGTAAKLPCNITPPVYGDKVTLVIWYKEGHPKPIYSFDSRQSKFEKGSHWVGEHFGGRTHFQADINPAILTIDSTKSSDSGIYRCRVDFQKSPTRNSKVQLKVIIPPEKLVILDNTGSHIPHYILGPYNEGSSINITCVSTGGNPLPNVTWWQENTMLDGTSNILSERRVSNILRLEKLNRRHLHMVLTCQASNNNLTTPISSSVTLDMNLRPLWIKLQSENRPLSADSSYQLPCIVVGSRPAPTITWWKGSTPMRNTHEITSSDGNMTTSILTFTPTIDDRGKFLSCRAEQTLIPESGIEDGWKLDIYHIPVVSLEFGTSSNNTIREGSDVYFECNIKSNPWIYRVSWRHNGNVLDNNQAEGIIVANQSLVLQNVSRARSGLYTCVGSNREGDGESNPIQLDVQFAPICRPGQRIVYSLGRQETAKIICEVEANPTNVTFVWRFNSSSVESIDIPASQFIVDGSRSISQYIPMTENDYGTLMCWGTNEIGSQVEPCIYNIIPAGEPDPLGECTVLNQTSSSFRIECLEGFDGGLEQDFIMEVYINGSTRNPKIFKSKIPHFEVFGLTPGMTYNVFLVAQNRKGRSNSTVLQIYTLKDPEKQTAYNADLAMAYAPIIEDIRRFLVILLGVVGIIFLVTLAIIVGVKLRVSSNRNRERAHFQRRMSQDNFRNDEHDNRMVRDARRVNSTDSIDRNPDIIPQDDREDEDEEWTTNLSSRSYATAALAEQTAAASSTYNILPYGVVEKAQSRLQQQQHLELQNLHHHHAPQYIKTYNTLIPAGGIGQKQNQADITYAELAVATQNPPDHRIPYCSATLGRPRHSEGKRIEPTIYAQIDLAHHPMYSTSPIYGQNTNTKVTMSHQSELVTFPSSSFVFAPVTCSTQISTPANLPELSSGYYSPAAPVTTLTDMVPTFGCSRVVEAQNTNILKTVPEEITYQDSKTDAGIKSNEQHRNYATRF